MKDTNQIKKRGGGKHFFKKGMRTFQNLFDVIFRRPKVKPDAGQPKI